MILSFLELKPKGSRCRISEFGEKHVSVSYLSLVCMCGVLKSVLACQTADPGSLPRSDDLVPSRVRVKFSNTVRIVHKSGHWSNDLLFHHSEMRNYLLPSGIRGSLREWAIYFGSIKLHEFSEPWFVYLNWVHESPLFCTFIEHEQFVNRIWWD